MNIRSKVLGAVAALVLLSGITIPLAVAGTASAATPSCGAALTSNCINIYSKQFPEKAFILDVFKQSRKVGQPVILFQRSNFDPAEDFTVTDEGKVSDFYAAGLVSPQVALHYGCEPGFRFIGGTGGTISCNYISPNGPAVYPDDHAGELEYAPYGVESGLCVGVASGVTGSKVGLYPCGTGPGTVWILDTVDICSNFRPFQVPLINGLDTNFSHPVVLTYPAGANPVDKPRVQLTITNLTGFSQNGPPSPNPSGCGSIIGPNSNQLWSAYFGIAQ